MKKLIIVALAVLCFSTVSKAQECPETCPEGQVLVTFSDGNNLSCACMEQSEGMVEEASPCEGEDCGESDVARELSQQDD